MNTPSDTTPVIALIQHVNSLGVSKWYEVVLYDASENKWISYAGSKTFNDGEQVVKWIHPDGINNWNIVS